MTDPSTQESAAGRLPELLAVIQELALELHPHRRGSLRVTPEAALDGDLGFDSLGRVELLLRIEQRFGARLPEHLLNLAETPADLLAALEHALPATAGEARAMRAAAPVQALEAVEAEPERAGTLVEALEWHVAAHPDRPHVTLLAEEGAGETLTYAGLLEGARAVAAGLLALDLKPAGPVAIMLPTCLEYFHSFMGVLLAGGVPVPIYPPVRPSQIEDHLRRHAGILANAGTSVLITVPEARVAARLLRMQVLSLRHIVTPQELNRTAGPAPRAAHTPQDIAHLQYTSGSTGNPKGVMLSHANLLANIRAMGRSLQVDSTDVFVSWLPLYHDMGLIGAWLGSLYFAMPLVLMSPLAFLVRPERWLWAIHDHRGTISGGPNFAYELCLNRIPPERLAGLELGSWRIAFNGAEPVIPGTLRRFGERFAAHGLRPETLAPVYGLAECSVGLTFPPRGRPPQIDRVRREPLIASGLAEPAGEEEPSALEFVACGIPLPGHEVRIVNETGHELGEREEGRLEFRGPSATLGYYRNKEQTRRLMHGEWLDSGDMAYIAGGDLHLTGRRKDIIIRAGRNIYPHELEEAIGELEGVRKGCVAVFGSSDARTGTERLVALVETRERDPARLDALRRAIDAQAVERLEMALDDIVLAPPHSVPKTSSGKIRRASSRELYEQGALGGGQRAVWLQVARLWLSGLLPQTRRLRRLGADLAYAGWWWTVLGLIAGPVWTAVALFPHPAKGWWVMRRVGRLLFRLIGVPLRVEGLEHLPLGRPCVLAVNHASYLDGLVVTMAFPGVWSFVAKRELVGSLFARWFLRGLGTEFVERFDKQRGVEDARRVAQVAAQGRSLVFFPEGTFRRQPGLLPFHLGAFQAAVEAGAPMVPVVIRGTRSILRDGQWLPRRGRVSVHVSVPMAPDGPGWNAALALRERVRAEMLRHYGEPDLIDQPVLL
jgi:1-acyl-sn-glycerol-3-phosphate acyltransferase